MMTNDLDTLYKTFIDLRSADKNAHLKMRYEGGKTFASLEIELSEKGIDETRERQRNRQKKEVDKMTEPGLELARPKTTEKGTTENSLNFRSTVGKNPKTAAEGCISTTTSLKKELQQGTIIDKNDQEKNQTTETIRRVGHLTILPSSSNPETLPRRTFLKSGESHDNEYPRRTFESEKISWKSAQRPNPLSPQISQRKAYSFIKQR